ncbi:hypothetical protein [Cryobacterium lyxosi]|uniref:Uncharacterized protein n=1 Tax=Cryobacterium lyxosi TaxID=1259228 RepID=A0A4R8ZK24_9MICO|nr:hypothetical protein [Cryobacterium lyxosi]TFD27752.1 hypothetical protein E3T27_04640 [Cryobacterium lyxosi]
MRMPRTRTQLRLERLEAKIDQLTLISESAQRNSNEALSLIRDLDHAAGASRPRHVVWLVIALVACVVGAITFTSLGAQAFNVPIASSDGFGSIDVAWGTDMPEVGEFEKINEVQAWVEIVTDEGFDRTSIDVRFPPESAGRDFLIVLKGFAQFKKFSESSYRVVTRQCEELPGISEDCQIISGTIPTGLPTDRFAGGYCVSHAEGEASPLVSLHGESKAIEATNWAYNTVSSPSIWGEKFALRTTTYQTIDLGARFAFANLDGCAIILRSIVRTTVETDPVQEDLLSDTFVRSGDNLAGVSTIVTKDRNADSIGQSFLATGAVFAGLAAGLAPGLASLVRKSRSGRRRFAAGPAPAPAP